MGKVIGVCGLIVSPWSGTWVGSDIMLWTGIDTHLKIHRIEVQNGHGSAMWRGQINNNRDGFSKLLGKLRLVEKSNSQQIGAVFMNPTGNYHAPVKEFLEHNGYRVILVDARISEHIRMADNLGREKSDGVDARILAGTAIKKPEILESHNHERSPLSGLTRLMNTIRSNITRLTNQIKSDLAAVFPEYPFYGDIDSKTSLQILQKYAVPEKITEVPLEGLAAEIRKASKGHFGLEKARELRDAAMNSIGIHDAEGIYALRIRCNISRIFEEKVHLARIENEIREWSSKNEHVHNISNISGISVISAAAMVSEIGNIDQFDSAMKLQAYGGKTPNMAGSGGKINARGVTRIRNPHLSNTVHESAVSLVAHRTPEFVDIFNREIKKGKKPTQAYIVVGKRLLYHIHSIMKNRKPYRERRPAGGEGPASNGVPI